MTVIAIVNRKGGSGKSTLATHVAAYLASRGQEVMLGDVDRQQSSRLWLNLRTQQLPKIHGWSIDENNFARPPAGVKHVVLDTPGGFHGFNLMKVTMYADAILIPVTSGVFDREAAQETLRELRTLPRIATGKCQLGCMGMRIDGRTRNGTALHEWAETQAIPHLGTIRLAQAYSKCMERGWSIFDFPIEKVAAYREEWQGLTHWLDLLLSAAPAAPGSRLERPEISRPPSSLILPSTNALRRA
ncbi:ParA family protein [Uliginosibacterium sp. 31-16]|uniref:ParA family protein n=1 Tax=Uliginosibacterium sp. 31-16 TaxID=3068315 RepID=UPI00273F2F4A|nr:ParA family protein [Uliginosibacterium sp. 31-16]MDP5239687.1 ParA family protein [Uliginosibacterium sp. 31-16]